MGGRRPFRDGDQSIVDAFWTSMLCMYMIKVTNCLFSSFYNLHNVLYSMACVWTHLAQVDLDELVVLAAVVGDQVVFELVRQGGDL